MLEKLKICYVFKYVVVVSKIQTHYCYNDNITFLVA